MEEGRGGRVGYLRNNLAKRAARRLVQQRPLPAGGWGGGIHTYGKYVSIPRIWVLQVEKYARGSGQQFQKGSPLG